MPYDQFNKSHYSVAFYLLLRAGNGQSPVIILLMLQSHRIEQI